MKIRILLYYLVVCICMECIGLAMCFGDNTNSESGIKDFMIAYRLPNEYSSDVVKEIHRWGNARYILLKTSDGRYVDETDETVDLGCTLATEDCKWKLSSGWGYTDWNASEDDHFTKNLDDMSLKENNCAETNGGCEVFCQMDDGKITCSCPHGYTNISRSCEFGSYETEIINKPGIYNKYNGIFRKWLIISPRNSTIRVVVSPECGRYCSSITVEFRTLLQNADDNSETLSKTLDYYTSYAIESNSILEITAPYESKFSINVAFIRKLLTLEEDSGWLTYEIKPEAGSICVCIIYTSPEQNEAIHLTTEFANGTVVEIEGSTERQFGKWKLRNFELLIPSNFNETVELKLTVTGGEITIHSIYGCRNLDTFVTRYSTTFPEIKYQENLHDSEPNSMEHCNNGGKFNLLTKKCTCPEGYVGDTCEEACGPYYIGPNCSIDCSSYNWGCRGTIFCKDGLPCLCAPGYRGVNCDQICDNNSYGINCLQKCGRCLGACDPHTGECDDSSCESGFRPPLCQIPYLYPKYSPKIINPEMNSVTLKFDTNELLGKGMINFYQLQYKKIQDTQLEEWIELRPQKPDGQIISANISGLLAGTEYSFRVIYIDADGNSYGGDLVPQTQFSTICIGPTSTDYNIDHSATSHSIDVSWKYTKLTNDCPVNGFTLILQRKGYAVERDIDTTKTYHVFDNLLSGTSYEVKIRANTSFGSAPYSIITIKTKDGVPLRVYNLQAKKNGLGKLLISWESPKFTAGIITSYTVLYRCLTIMGCKVCDDSQKEIEVPGNQRSVELRGLRHHTQYSIKVAAVAGDMGPFSVVFGLTQDAAPNAAPEGVQRSLLSSTNTSVTIQWFPVRDCEFVNGYFIGYHYRLWAPNNTLLAKGETYYTNITLYNLTPITLYAVHIFAVSSGGINEDQKLIINATTAATVPDKVQNLTIYKRGRRVLGLRWFPPINTYGEIESFSISHCQLNNCLESSTVVVKPKPCIPWPIYFCHTITGLLPNSQYSVSVRARNVLVEQYGTAATVSATTSEGAPETPISLHVKTRNTRSLILEWMPPQQFNGVLRSFLINVEHLDSSNTTNCCTYFPLHEFVIKSEEEKYIYEVTDLSPASKYTIGVSAKTISIGPTTSVTVNTPPEMLKLKHVPELIDENTVKITSEGRFPGLVGTYLLLIFPENGNTRPIIWDPELSRKFQSIIKNNFYIAAELDAEDVLTSAEIEIGKGESPRNGTIGIVEDPELTTKFNIGLALVLEYNGAANVAVIEAPDV